MVRGRRRRARSSTNTASPSAGGLGAPASTGSVRQPRASSERSRTGRTSSIHATASTPAPVAVASARATRTPGRPGGTGRSSSRSQAGRARVRSRRCTVVASSPGTSAPPASTTPAGVTTSCPPTRWTRRRTTCPRQRPVPVPVTATDHVSPSTRPVRPPPCSTSRLPSTTTLGATRSDGRLGDAVSSRAIPGVPASPVIRHNPRPGESPASLRTGATRTAPVATAASARAGPSAGGSTSGRSSSARPLRSRSTVVHRDAGWPGLHRASAHPSGVRSRRTSVGPAASPTTAMFDSTGPRRGPVVTVLHVPSAARRCPRSDPAVRASRSATPAPPRSSRAAGRTSTPSRSR